MSPTPSFAADEGEHLEASDLSDLSDLNDTNDINDINDINDSELSIYFDLDSASGPALVIAHSPASMAAAPLLADTEGEIDSHLPPAILDLSPMTDFSIQLAGIRVLACLAEILRPFIFVHVNLLAALYFRAFGYPLFPDEADSFKCPLSSIGIYGLEVWDPRRLLRSNFLRRYDCAPEVLRSILMQRLGPVGGSCQVVFSSCLSYALFTLSGMVADDVTGALLDKMFFAIAGMHLQSLRVVTARGVESLSNDGICKLAKDWLQSVASVTRTADNVKVLLDQARLCSEDYFSRCALGADHDGSIALEMLRNAKPNVHLFLGMGENEIVVLYRNLPFLVGKDTSIDTMDIITYVSDGLFDRFY
ncbi:hypothetical protein GGI06_001023 [Coemansia sp. S85]|nr:hypothetical protein GGI06_001023 [Coemansia sp. S85]